MATILKNDGANYFRQMKKSCAIFIYLAPLAPLAMPSGNPGKIPKYISRKFVRTCEILSYIILIQINRLEQVVRTS